MSVPTVVQWLFQWIPCLFQLRKPNWLRTRLSSFFCKKQCSLMFSATSNVSRQPNSERKLCVLVNTKTKGWPDPDSALCAPSRQLPSHTLQRGSKASSADGVWHLGLGSDTSSCHIRHSWGYGVCGLVFSKTQQYWNPQIKLVATRNLSAVFILFGSKVRRCNMLITDYVRWGF